jgi:glutathionyl-hydroquinone reductase
MGNDNADISRMKPEADGTFKRKAASFRSHITKDGQYTPEKGTFLSLASERCEC